ncbi:ASCH domain-containing protein [Rhizobium leguminosarum]|uniref:ASCH domain-containing protein n=1 Tax=Rhizobium leguminosarum TaxID=384 RepID=UPI001C960050|nr:ASCH domain-containing protein [Rhizobium leguminosarum]MBY5400273.1 ASCH domain-containing protein [Rhizobium leguminosarum]
MNSQIVARSSVVVTKALVIAQPWISLILAGQKDWEMRSTPTSHRGWFGLVWKGMGSVYGVARLIDVNPPQSPEQMIETIERHRIPEEMIRSGEVASWNTPWVLADVRRLETPVRYRHKSGAVTWVNLDEEVTDAIARQMNHGPQSGEVLAAIPEPETLTVANNRKFVGEVEITQGNIDHKHIYLRNFFDGFPSDAIGGSSKAEKAAREIVVDWGQGTVRTDLDGSKKLFRARGWIGSFFRANGVVAGDRVRVEETGPYQYNVTVRKS